MQIFIAPARCLFNSEPTLTPSYLIRELYFCALWFDFLILHVGAQCHVFSSLCLVVLVMFVFTYYSLYTIYNSCILFLYVQ